MRFDKSTLNSNESKRFHSPQNLAQEVLIQHRSFFWSLWSGNHSPKLHFWSNHVGNSPGLLLLTLKREKGWVLWFDRSRWLVGYPQCVGFLFFGLNALIFNTLLGTKETCDESTVFRIIIIGAMAEIALNQGYIWYTHHSRTLPYWSLNFSPFKILSKIFWDNKTLNHVCSLIFLPLN